MAKRAWIAVLDTAASIVAVRSDLREVPLSAAGAAAPAPGDRVAVMTLPSALLIGAGTVGRVRPGGVLLLRDRIRAPAGHAVDPYALRPEPSFAHDVPRDRLPASAGAAIAVSERDRVRIGAVIRAQAMSFGPARATTRLRSAGPLTF